MYACLHLNCIQPNTHFTHTRTHTEQAVPVPIMQQASGIQQPYRILAHLKDPLQPYCIHRTSTQRPSFLKLFPPRKLRIGFTIRLPGACLMTPDLT